MTFGLSMSGGESLPAQESLPNFLSSAPSESSGGGSRSGDHAQELGLIRETLG